MRRKLAVVGAVIVSDGLVLCAQRGPDGSLAGLWEFPGGKVEPGESLRLALAREIREELACSIDVGDEVTTTVHDYDFAEVTLTTFFCRLRAGQPESAEHADLVWLAASELETLDWAPADVPAVSIVRSALS